MKMRIGLITTALLFVSSLVMAQRVRLEEGDLKFMEGVKKMNVQYDYSQMKVGKKSEKEYIQDKKEDYNTKEPGKGDKWEKAWVDDRGSRFEPRFKEEFEKTCDITIGDYPTEKYTLVFKTVYTEPGYNVGVMRKNAYIDGEAWIVETANPSHILAKFTVENCPGRTFGGYDFDSGERIQEAYAVAGKGLGKYIRKETK